MEEGKLIFDCLTFTFKGKKYLYRLTRAFYLNVKKFDVDFIILPTFSYHLKLKSFGWFIDCLEKIKCKTILAKDDKVYKNIESIISSLDKYNTKFEVWKQTYFNQKQLINLSNKLIQQSQFKNKQQSNEIPIEKSQRIVQWFNNTPQKYSFFFPQFGTSFIFSNQTSVYLCNVQQKILSILQQSKVPLMRIEALFLLVFQMHTFIGFLQMFFYLKKFTLITTLQNYNKLKNHLFLLFKISQQMINRRCSVRIIKDKKQVSYQSMKLYFEDGLNPNFKIFFDKQYIKIYCKQMSFYPKELQQSELIFMILYNIDPKFKEIFQTIPQPLRRKIILNRPTHKYNHQYFCILNNGKQGNVKTFQIKNKRKTYQPVSLWLEEKEVSQYITKKVMKHGEKINASKRAIKVCAGCIIGEKSGNVYFEKDQIQKEQFIFCQKSAIILIISLHEYEMIKRINLSQQSINKQENKFKAFASENSILRNLSNEQLDLLNLIGKPNSYESGQSINISQKKNQKVFFILKGGMKWQGTNDQQASKGFFIGNIQLYASHNPIYGDINVIKDTWVLEIKIQEFFDQFLVDYPQILIDILSKGVVFG